MFETNEVRVDVLRPLAESNRIDTRVACVRLSRDRIREKDFLEI